MPKKVTALTPTTNPGLDAVIHVVITPSGTPTDRKAALGEIFKSYSGNVNVLSHASLSAAITAIGATATTLLIPASMAVTASLTIPKNVVLTVSGVGEFNVSSGQTLTINGPLVAPRRQIFTGSGSVRFGASISTAYPEWFGAVMDGTTDDSAAIQKAIDAFSPAGNMPAAGEVFIGGYTAIASTLTIEDTNAKLKGCGISGSQSGEASRVRSVIRWVGSAGSPMILIHNLAGGVEGLTLKGKTAAKPSAAIEISETSVFCDATLVRDVWIGSTYGFDDDNGVQFDRGIYFSGSVDCDTNLLQRVFINNCTTGIDVANLNAAISHYDVLQTIGCGTGIKTVAPQILVTNWICAQNDVDLDLAAQGVDVTLQNYVSEGSGRMAIGSAPGPLRLVVDGGGFQADGNTGKKFHSSLADYSGKRAFLQFKTITAGNGLWLEVRNFNLQQIGTPAIPVIQAWNTSDDTTASGATQVYLRMVGVKGFTSNNFDVGGDSNHNAHKVVHFEPQASNNPVGPNLTRFVSNAMYGSEDYAYQDQRTDFTGKVNVYGGKLHVKALPTPTGVAVTPTGSGATTYSYKVTALTNEGETVVSAAVTCVNGTLGTGGRLNTITLFPVVGASGYKIYGRTSGSELLMKTLTLAEVGDTSSVVWVDDGSVTPSGALPVVNSTGAAIIDGSLKVGSFTTTQRDALTAANGMILYNSTTNKFQGYAGGAWVDLH